MHVCSCTCRPPRAETRAAHRVQAYVEADKGSDYLVLLRTDGPPAGVTVVPELRGTCYYQCCTDYNLIVSFGSRMHPGVIYSLS